MSNDLIPFDFEQHTIRVIMIEDEPWFVANDLAAVLGYRDAHNMTRNLRPRQRDTHKVSTSSGDQTMLIISEGGMYRAVLRSKKPEAERFQDFVEEELLPALRRTGRYVLHEERAPSIMDQDAPRLSACVAVVREARRLYGVGAARVIWARLGLPAPIVDAHFGSGGDILAEALRNWLVGRHYTTAREAAAAMGLNGSRSDLFRVTGVLSSQGWVMRKTRVGDTTENRWFGPASFEGGEA